VRSGAPPAKGASAAAPSRVPTVVWAAATGKGEKVLWDAANMKPTNMPELEAVVKPHYRGGYTLDC